MQTPEASRKDAAPPDFDETPLTARVWTGRALAEKAEQYREYLMEEGVKVLARIPGNRGVQTLVFPEGKHCEFMVISYWVSPEAIAGWAGADIMKIRDLPRDEELLVDRAALARHGLLKVDFWPAIDR